MRLRYCLFVLVVAVVCMSTPCKPDEPCYSKGYAKAKDTGKILVTFTGKAEPFSVSGCIVACDTEGDLSDQYPGDCAVISRWQDGKHYWVATVNNPTKDKVLAELQHGEQNADDPHGLLAEINKVRARYSLPTLSLSPALVVAAKVSADTQAARGQCGHFSRLVGASEICAGGQSSAAAAVQGWLGSPGHRNAMLGQWSRMGGARSGPYWAVQFE